jgi:peptide/nickel transport system ATP-binding protein
VVKNVSDRVAVMYLGKLCEVAASDLLYAAPAHPYTRVLIDSIPVPDPTVVPATPPASGEPPSAVYTKEAQPSGCRFASRCRRATSICAQVEPTLTPVPGTGGGLVDHFVACHHPLTDDAEDMTPH